MKKRGCAGVAGDIRPFPKPHPAEIHHRETKAWTIVAALRAAGVTAEDAAHMDEAAWLAATRAAQVTRERQFAGRPAPAVTPPSAKTRRLIVQMLAGSAAPAAIDPVKLPRRG